MNIKFVSKNNLGMVAVMILVIMLSQSRFFDFLTDTSFGRLSLLALIVFIASTHKVLGLLAVLFVIIAFNYNDTNTVYSYNFYEGFDISGNSITDGSGNPIIQAKETKIEDKTNVIKNKINADSQTTTSTSSSTSSTSESFGAREGFCMSDRELQMLRGKQSSTVPVYNKSREQPEDVDPTDKSIFSGGFSIF